MRIGGLCAALLFLVATSAAVRAEPAGWSVDRTLLDEGTARQRAIIELRFGDQRIDSRLGAVWTPKGAFEPVAPPPWAAEGKPSWRRVAEPAAPPKTGNRMTLADEVRGWALGTAAARPGGVGPSWLFLKRFGVWLNPQQIDAFLVHAGITPSPVQIINAAGTVLAKDAQYAAVLQAARRGNAAALLTAARKLAKKYANRAEPWWWIGAAHEHALRIDKAAAAYGEAARRQRAIAWSEVCVGRLKQRRVADAKRALRELGKLNPKWAEAVERALKEKLGAGW